MTEFWTEHKVARLRVLWAEGVSMRLIAVRLGCSKNAVMSKTHRLDLPKRPTPIRPVGVRRSRVPRFRGQVPTLPILESLRTASQAEDGT
jgi:GcrA cell cycle regulator